MGSILSLFTGCQWFNKNVSPVYHEFDGPPNLYNCHQECMNTTNLKYDFIGMQKRKCYCLLDKDFDNNTKLNCEGEPCGTNKKILCSQNETQMEAVVTYALKSEHFLFWSFNHRVERNIWIGSYIYNSPGIFCIKKIYRLN